MKCCRLCGETKPLAEFYRSGGSRDGHRTECKACNLATRREKYRENPRPYIDRVLRWQQDNHPRYLARMRAYNSTPKKRLANRKSHLKRKYGLTLEGYDRLLEAQGGVCAICGGQGRDDTSLHVDHDHETGAIRGLLCFRCNNALGDLGDSHERFRAAAEYLDRDELSGVARARAATLIR